MKAFVAVLALVAVAQAGVISPAATTLLAAPAVRTVAFAAPAAVVAAPTIARVPSLDSAVIQSDRIGGNFAYSVAESHAHAITSPVIQHVAQPVAVSYSAPQIVAAQHVVAAPQIAAVRTIASPAISYIGAPAGTVLLK